MKWYERVKFDCPQCGARLIVESGQAVRREVVTCSECNADLALAPRATGKGAAPGTDAGGQSATPIPRGAFVVEL